MNAAHRKICNKSAEDFLEKFDEEMLEKLQEAYNDYLEGLATEDVSGEELANIYLRWQEDLPDPGQWAGEKAYEEYENAMEDKADMARDEAMEREME